MRRASKGLLLVAGVTALIPAYLIMSNCDSSDSAQTVGLFLLPAFTAIAFGTLGWQWPVGASAAQRLGVAIFCGAFVGAIGFMSVALVFVGSCEG